MPRTAGRASRSEMVASIGAVAAPAQGASYYERDGYYAKDDPEHREASGWAGKARPASAARPSSASLPATPASPRDA